ncbi:MAG: hypothetical protein PHG31_06695 [Candidatus Omnitrophica bacterium]|nr:hypothetical protein [Candidatus Omnitrophota bacterium]
MPKERKNLIPTITHFFMHHPWLKLIALILAVIVWIYVRGEIAQFNY